MEGSSDIRDRAERIKQDLLDTRICKPVFIEFSGTPKSGKSACIDILVHFFRRLKFKVLAPTEGASQRTPYYLKENWLAFNTWSASYALMHVLEGLHGSDRYDLAILDRGLFDALAWFELLERQGDITQAERDHIHAFLRIKEWQSAIDAVFMFKTDPATSLERENQHKLIKDPGKTMNRDVIDRLNKAYDSVTEKYSREFPKFEIVDTSESKRTTPKSTSNEVTRSILEVMETKITESCLC